MRTQRGRFIWHGSEMTTLSSEANKIFVLQNHVFGTCHVLTEKLFQECC